jgi:fermentation-respiration switch protein FrsA (DUF1100 family)
MLVIEEKYIKDIPVLHVAEEKGPNMRPAFIFHHGMASAKEHNLHIAYTIAKAGFRVFLPDALHHGEREEKGSGIKRQMAFWDIVLHSIKELPIIAEALADEGLVSQEGISVGGTSMGAITTFGALASHRWIQSGCCFMGAPQYEQFAEQLFLVVEQNVEISEDQKKKVLEQIRSFDLSKQIGKLANRPLFIWHGKADETVPFSFSEQFVEQLQQTVDYQADKLLFLPEDSAGHKVSRKAMLAAAKWLSGSIENSKPNVRSYV